MKWMLIALLAALAGCAHTPQELLDTGKREERTSTKPPASAAICLIRNIEVGPFYSYAAQQRLLDDRGSIEVVLRIADRFTQAILRYEPMQAGSKISVWTCTLETASICRPGRDPEGIEWWFKGC